MTVAGGQYTIHEPLGEGGYGQVWRAYDHEKSRAVAIKFLTIDLVEQDPRVVERFRLEARIGYQTYHPHILPVIDDGEDPDLHWHYLVMPLVPDGSLHDLVAWAHGQGSWLVPDVTLDILLGVARALDFAHTQGVIHRDVKPANILLHNDGSALNALLSDFGVAHLRDRDRLTDTGQALGTYEFMAPEYFRPRAEFDGTVDQYALAATVYLALTGWPPFVSENRLALPQMHLNDEPPPISGRRGDLPGALDTALAKGLAKSPKDRYRNCHELIHACRAAIGTPEKEPPPPSLPRPDSREYLERLDPHTPPTSNAWGGALPRPADSLQHEPRWRRVARRRRAIGVWLFVLVAGAVVIAVLFARDDGDRVPGGRDKSSKAAAVGPFDGPYNADRDREVRQALATGTATGGQACQVPNAPRNQIPDGNDARLTCPWAAAPPGESGVTEYWSLDAKRRVAPAYADLNTDGAVGPSGPSNRTPCPGGQPAEGEVSAAGGIRGRRVCLTDQSGGRRVIWYLDAANVIAITQLAHPDRTADVGQAAASVWRAHSIDSWMTLRRYDRGLRDRRRELANVAAPPRAEGLTCEQGTDAVMAVSPSVPTDVLSPAAVALQICRRREDSFRRAYQLFGSPADMDQAFEAFAQTGSFIPGDSPPFRTWQIACAPEGKPGVSNWSFAAAPDRDVGKRQCLMRSDGQRYMLATYADKRTLEVLADQSSPNLRSARALYEDHWLEGAGLRP